MALSNVDDVFEAYNKLDPNDILDTPEIKNGLHHDDWTRIADINNKSIYFGKKAEKFKHLPPESVTKEMSACTHNRTFLRGIRSEFHGLSFKDRQIKMVEFLEKQKKKVEA